MMLMDSLILCFLKCLMRINFSRSFDFNVGSTVFPVSTKGMTRAHLDRCLAVQPDSPWGLRNRAMISLGYDLLTRRSELVALQTSDIEFRGDDTLRALIRRGKADPFGIGRIAFSSKRSGDLIRARGWQAIIIRAAILALRLAT